MGATEERSRLQLKLKKLTSKIEWVKKKGGGCSVCGYYRNLAALEFHHTDSEKKTDNPSNILGNKDQSELDSCVLVCRICHVKIHASRGQERKHITRNYTHLLNILGWECGKCGLELNAAVREFDLHHPRGVEKTGAPVVLVRNYKKHREELEQLIPLCKVCHAEIHWPHLSVGEPLDTHLRKLEREFRKFPEVNRVSEGDFFEAVEKCGTIIELSKYLEISYNTACKKAIEFGITKYLSKFFRQGQLFKEMLERGETKAKIMEELGISNTTFYKWKKRI